MLNDCVKAVDVHRKSVQSEPELSTQAMHTRICWWKRLLLIRGSVHNFCIQLCTPKLPVITDWMREISPLSTGLIMNMKWNITENLIIGSGG
jgi:hypothetical protein